MSEINYDALFGTDEVSHPDVEQAQVKMIVIGPGVGSHSCCEQELNELSNSGRNLLVGHLHSCSKCRKRRFVLRDEGNRLAWRPE
jgi:hypothetical protein